MHGSPRVKHTSVCQQQQLSACQPCPRLRVECWHVLSLCRESVFYLCGPGYYCCTMCAHCCLNSKFAFFGRRKEKQRAKLRGTHSDIWRVCDRVVLSSTKTHPLPCRNMDPAFPWNTSQQTEAVGHTLLVYNLKAEAPPYATLRPRSTAVLMMYGVG